MEKKTARPTTGRTAQDKQPKCNTNTVRSNSTDRLIAQYANAYLYKFNIEPDHFAALSVLVNRTCEELQVNPERVTAVIEQLEDDGILGRFIKTPKDRTSRPAVYVRLLKGVGK